MGGLVGPALGGLLADVSGLRAPFTMTGIAAAAAAVYGLLRLPETRKLGEARAERARAAEAEAEAEADAEAEAGPASTVRRPMRRAPSRPVSAVCTQTSVASWLARPRLLFSDLRCSPHIYCL